MVHSQNNRSQLHLVKSALRRQLAYGVKHVINALKDRESEVSTVPRMRVLADSYAKRAGNAIYFAHNRSFVNKEEARALTMSYFNANWAAAFQKAMIKSRYYKTPNGGIVYVPQGEVSYFNEDGAAYAIKVDAKEYFWNHSEELYYDIYGSIYNPNGDVLIGNSSPRYAKEAHKKLVEVRVRYPNAYLSQITGNDMPEYLINHFDAHNEGMTSFGGAYYNNKAFNERDYPEVGKGEYFAPIWGSGKQAYHDFQDGDYGWATFNSGMAVSDLFLVRSLFGGFRKAVLAKGVFGGSTQYFGYGMSHEYGASVSRWKNLGVNMTGKKHHWAISQKLMENQPWLKPIGNQTWNLKLYSSQASHMRWGHGKAFPSEELPRIPYWKIVYPISSTPSWFKFNGVYSGGRIGENYLRNE